MINYYGNEIEYVPTIKESSKAKYISIAQSIEDDIQNGKLKHGQMLPPQRLIANYLGINHGTVTKAYKLCEEKGLIKGVIGKGTFVSGSAGLPVSLLTDHDDNNIISLGMALPLYETNPLIESHIKEISANIDYNIALKYCPPEGLLKHRYIAANWLNQFKINTKAENILITSGTQNALAVILLSTFNKSDRIIVDEFTYSGLKSLAKYLGIILVPVTGDKNGMNVDELKKTCKRENIRGIYLMPDCHNPTSIVMSEKKRHQIAEVIKEYDLLLIEDATFGFTVTDKIMPISGYVPKNSFYINGTSKAISPTFRISYVVAPEKYTKQLQQGLNNITWMSSPYTAEIISLLQSTSRYELITNAKLEILKKRNEIFDEEFSSYNVIPSIHSMFRYLELPDDWDCSELERLALKAGVQIFSASRFSAGTHNVHNAIRIALSSAKTNEELMRGLKILKQVLTSFEYSANPIV